MSRLATLVAAFVAVSVRTVAGDVSGLATYVAAPVTTTTTATTTVSVGAVAGDVSRLATLIAAPVTTATTTTVSVRTFAGNVARLATFVAVSVTTGERTGRWPRSRLVFFAPPVVTVAISVPIPISMIIPILVVISAFGTIQTKPECNTCQIVTTRRAEAVHILWENLKL
jgi:hypothetical protein